MGGPARTLRPFLCARPNSIPTDRRIARVYRDVRIRIYEGANEIQPNLIYRQS